MPIISLIVSLVAITVWMATGNDLAFFLLVSIAVGFQARFLLDPTERITKVSWVLAGTCLINLVLLLRLSLFSTGPVGVDPWFHAAAIRDTVQDGRIPSSAGGYQSFPLFHLLGAQASLVIGVHPFASLEAIIAIMAATPVVVYLVARRFLPIRISLFIALLFSVSDYFLLWEIWMIPMTLGILLFVFLLHNGLHSEDTSVERTVASALIMVALVLVHPLVTIIALLALASYRVALMASAIFFAGARHGKVRVGNLLVFAILTVSWWMYSITPAGVDFVQQTSLALRNVLDTIGLGNVETLTRAGSLPYLIVLSRDIGLCSLFVLVPIGIVLGARNIRSGPSLFALGVVGLSMLAFPLIAGVIGGTLLLPERWFVFAYAFGWISGGIALATIAGVLGGIPRPTVAALVAGALALSMISGPLGNVVERPYQQDVWTRPYYSAAEIEAPTFLAKHAASLPIVSDGAFLRQVVQLWHRISTNATSLSPAWTASFPVTEATLIIVRGRLTYEPVLVAVGPSIAYYDFLPARFWAELRDSPMVSRIYENGDVSIYRLE